MGVKMQLSSAETQGQAIAADAKTVEHKMQSYITAVNRFTSNKEGMQGSSFDSARNWFSTTHIPLARGIIAYAKGLSSASGKFLSNYRSEVDSVSLDEDKLRRQIQKLRAQQNQYSDIVKHLRNLAALDQSDMRSAISSINSVSNGLASDETKLQRKLKKLVAYNPVSDKPFNRLDAIWSQIQSGLRTLNNKGHYTSDGFTTSGVDIAWAVQLNRRYAESIVAEISTPKNMPEKERKAYKAEMYKNIDELADQGWADSSIRAFVNYANEHATRDQAKLLTKKPHESLAEYYHDKSQQVGTGVFLAMWKADKITDDSAGLSKLRHSQEKLATLMKVAAMPQKGLSGETKQTIDLLKHFGNNLKPNANFWSSLAKTVQTAFPDGIAKSPAEFPDLGRLVHQYRYVISAQQIKYIRDHYSGKDDGEKLANYVAENPGYHSESARLHQKGFMKDGTIHYPDGIDTNLKITANEEPSGFHSEFVLSVGKKESDGESPEMRFVSELDDQGATLNGIVNGSSFNYANSNNGVHSALDVNYGEKNDPQFRTDTLNNLDNNGKAHPYKAPKIPNKDHPDFPNEWNKSSKNNQQYYVGGKSPAKRVDEVGKKFWDTVLKKEKFLNKVVDISQGEQRN